MRLLLVVLLLGTQGCSCLDEPGPGNTGGGSGGGGAGAGGGSAAGAFDPALNAYGAAQGERCFATFVTSGGGLDPLTPESLAVARTAYATGETDIALSPTGCTRMLVTRDGGQVLREAIVAPPFGLTVTGYSSAITVFTYTATGETMRSDENADGVIDVTYDFAFGQQLKREVMTDDGRVRVTLAPTDAGIAVTEDVLFDGTLVSRSRLEQPKQWACVESQLSAPEPPGPIPQQPVAIDCPGGLQATLQQRREDAAELLGGCLQAMGSSSRAAEMYRMASRGKTAVGCEFAIGGVAYNDTNYYLQTGWGRVIVDQTEYFAASPGEQTGKMAHELMHFLEVHDDELLGTLNKIADSDKTARIRSLSDRTTACEFACFRPDADLCHLARCMNKTLDTTWNMTSCAGSLDEDTIARVERMREHIFTVTRPGMATPGSLRSCNQGKNVGAICRERGPGNVGGVARFCDTLDECKATCKTTCESLSISCNKSCR